MNWEEKKYELVIHQRMPIKRTIFLWLYLHSSMIIQVYFIFREIANFELNQAVETKELDSTSIWIGF